MPPIPRAHVLDVGPLSPNVKHMKKESMLATLSKLGERDTQQKAIDELRRVITGLDEGSLGVLVSCLCATGTEQKVLARKECVRALGLLASALCPVQAQCLQQPILGKVINYLKTRMKDPDNTVRETAGDALAQIAEHLYSQDSMLIVGDIAFNPMLRAAYDTMLEHKKEVQQAGAYALSKVVCYTKPLVPGLWKTLLKLLSSNLFPAKATLIAAMARCEGDTWQPKGLVQGGPSALQPYLGQLIGQPLSAKSNSSGLVAALSSPDWPVKRAAAEALKALVIALGPGLDSPGQAALPAGVQAASSRAADALEKCRFDKVRPVRDAVQEAQAVLLDLQEFMNSGSSASDWGSWLAPRLLARGITMSSPPRNRPVSPGRQSPTSRPTSALRRAGSHSSVHERFCMAGVNADQVAETGAARQQSSQPSLAADAPPSTAVITDTTAPRHTRETKSEGQVQATCDSEQGSVLEGSCTDQTGPQLTAQSAAAEQSTHPVAEQESDASMEEDKHGVLAAAETHRSPMDFGRRLSHAASGSGASMDLARAGSGSGAGFQLSQNDCTSTSLCASDMSLAAGAAGAENVRPARDPLAAVQEGSAPMLGSLSFKPASLQRMHDEGFEGVSQNQQEGSEPGRSRSRRLAKRISLEEQRQPPSPTPTAQQDWDAMALQMQKLQEQQGRVLGMMDSLSLSTQAALAGLERRLLAVEAKVDSYQPGLQGSSSASRCHHTRPDAAFNLAQDRTASVGMGPDSSASGAVNVDQKTPIFNDGMFEAVGLRSGYHTAMVMGGLYYKVHGMRLAQASEMQLDLKVGGAPSKGGAPMTHMQLDGEPWQQELPFEDGAPPMHIHVSPSGTSNMLFNTEKLRGMPKKIKALVRREAEVSLVQQLSIGTPTPGSTPTPNGYPGLGSAKGATPRTPITAALPTTRQADSPQKNHRRMKSGNPAVPVAQAAGTPRQRGSLADDSTEQALSLGRPSDPTDDSTPVPLGVALSPSIAGQGQSYISPSPVEATSSQPMTVQGMVDETCVPLGSTVVQSPAGQLPGYNDNSPVLSSTGRGPEVGHGQAAANPAAVALRGSLGGENDVQARQGQQQISPALGSSQDRQAQSGMHPEQQHLDRLTLPEIPPQLTVKGITTSSQTGADQEAMSLQSAAGALTDDAEQNRQQQQSGAGHSSVARMFVSGAQSLESVPGSSPYGSSLGSTVEPDQSSSAQSPGPPASSPAKPDLSSTDTGAQYTEHTMPLTAAPPNPILLHTSSVQSGQWRNLSHKPPSASWQDIDL